MATVKWRYWPKEKPKTPGNYVTVRATSSEPILAWWTGRAWLASDLANHGPVQKWITVDSYAGLL